MPSTPPPGSAPNRATGPSLAERQLAALERLLAIDALELEAALAAAAQLVAEVFSADKADVFLLEQSSSTLVALGTSQTPMGIKQRQLGLHRLPLANRGRVVETFESGVTYCSGRVHEDPGVLVGIREALGVRSMVACAFAHAGDALAGPAETSLGAPQPERPGDQAMQAIPTRRGVLLLSSAQVDYFSLADVPFVETVARWIGLVVHRARLADRVRAHAVEAARLLAAEELVTVLAHDLRNYLAPMKARLQLLLRDAQRDTQPRYAERASGSLRDVARLESLVTDLLDVNRLERGTFAVLPQPTELGALARETAAAMTSESVMVRAIGDEPVEVPADPARVRQAVENLIANAIQHSPPGAEVVVRAARDQSLDGSLWGVLSVRDEGEGIPVEQLAALFTRYGAGASSIGLGLGLYIARRIAEAHGGEVTVDSAPGAGATFHLRLPAASGINSSASSAAVST